MRITWTSNAPWAGTGYGTQTAQMLKRLKADGHEVAVAANFGLMAGNITDPVSGALVLPLGADIYGNDVIQAHDQLWTAGQPSWIITLYDVWVYDAERFASANVASWIPVDHFPLPPKVAHWARQHPAIAMSRFGEERLKAEKIPAMYAPHAIELDIWKPTDALPDGTSVRKALNIPEDAFLVMINAANKGNVPPRKAWGEMLSAMTMFMRERPDVYLYMHTLTGLQHGGVDLVVLQQALGMDMARIRVPDQYATLTGLIPQSVLAATYTAADVLLATSMGEGFGIPVIEAQACGTSVIVTDFSAQPELVGSGWRVPFQPYWDFTQAAWLALPMVGAIVKALNESYEARGDANRREAALAKATEYDADKVYAEHWRPILADLEERLKPVKRAARRKNARAKKRAA